MLTRVGTAASVRGAGGRIRAGLASYRRRVANESLNAHLGIASCVTYYYAALHFLVTPLVLVWLWRRRPEAYAWLRSGLAIASAIALLGYRFWPLAPPRLAVSGTRDTLAGVLGQSHGAASLVNQYAAMPSLHVGWAVWCAVAVIVTTRPQAGVRFSAVLYPTATTLVVIGTANHYVVDVIAGAAVVLASLAVTSAGRGPSYVEMPVTRRAGTLGEEHACELWSRDPVG